MTGGESYLPLCLGALPPPAQVLARMKQLSLLDTKVWDCLHQPGKDAPFKVGEAPCACAGSGTKQRADQEFYHQFKKCGQECHSLRSRSRHGASGEGAHNPCACGHINITS